MLLDKILNFIEELEQDIVNTNYIIDDVEKIVSSGYTLEEVKEVLEELDTLGYSEHVVRRALHIVHQNLIDIIYTNSPTLEMKIKKLINCLTGVLFHRPNYKTNNIDYVNNEISAMYKQLDIDLGITTKALKLREYKLKRPNIFIRNRNEIIYVVSPLLELEYKGETLRLLLNEHTKQLSYSFDSGSTINYLSIKSENRGEINNIYFYLDSLIKKLLEKGDS